MLTREELKLLRKSVGKLNWLATNTRPDTAIYALDLAKRQKKATLKDLRSVNRVLKKVHKKESKVKFKKIGNREDLCLVGVCDASYQFYDNSVGGDLLMLENKKTDAASPIYWKSSVI